MWVPIIIILTLLTLWLTRARAKVHPPLPPGPRGLPVVGSLFSLSPQLHSYFADLARTYGPIFSLRMGGRYAVVISSPAMAREVLREHDITFANRDVPVAGKVTYGGHDIVWNPYGPEWRLLRRVCVRDMLCAATLDSVYGLRRREVRRTISYIWKRVGTTVNVGEQMHLTAMNVVMGMLWSGGTEGEAERERRGREFQQVIAEVAALAATPNVSDFYPALAWLDLQGIEKKVKGLVDRFDAIFDKVIQQRLKMGGAGEGRGKDFLEVLLKMMDEYEESEEDGGKRVSFSMTHLKALLMDMVAGGTDTSSNTVEFAMAEVHKKPKVLKRIHEELDTVVGKDNIVEEQHIHKLPYLLAVMKETLRLHPPLPLLIPHRPSKSCIIGGYTVPEDTRIFVNAWDIHRDPSAWADPLEFDPDRFLNTDRKFDFNGNDFAYIPFGSGRRSCAGIGMAERMVMYALGSMLHSFDWEVPQGEELDVEEKFGFALCKRVPLTLIPKPRLSSPSLYE